MKEKVRKSSLEYAFLFLVSIFIFHTDVLVYEMELGQRTQDEEKRDIDFFCVHVSEVWTSKGERMLSYDVSESGNILISFPNHKVGVFDSNMQFLFELSFQGSSGLYGAAWHGENILLVDLRYPAVVECSMDGAVLGSHSFDTDYCYTWIIMEDVKKCGEYRYRRSESRTETGFSCYTYLSRISEENGEEIVYRSDNIFIWERYPVYGLLLLLLGSIGLLCRMAVVLHKGEQASRGKPLCGIRTYSTDYSMDDCIGLLSRKNIYDVLRYSFCIEKENTAKLVVTGHNQFTGTQTRACYEMEFRGNAKTEIDIRSNSGGVIFLTHYIPQWWMDEFMAQKLDALPMDTEPENMGAGQI